MEQEQYLKSWWLRLFPNWWETSIYKHKNPKGPCIQPSKINRHTYLKKLKDFNLYLKDKEKNVTVIQESRWAGEQIIF